MVSNTKELTTSTGNQDTGKQGTARDADACGANILTTTVRKNVNSIRRRTKKGRINAPPPLLYPPGQGRGGGKVMNSKELCSLLANAVALRRTR